MKHTGKEYIRLLIIQGHTDDYIKKIVGTTSDFVKQCRIEVRDSNSITKIDKKIK